MSVLKRLGRTPAVQAAAGLAMARYLKLVRATNRFVLEPPDLYDRLAPIRPFIAAMWHGQHFMVPLVRRPEDPSASLVSRSRDGEINAIVLAHLGVRAIRGSGARGRNVRDKGGVAALRDMVRALDQGETVALTADVPKVSRRCGAGIIALARLSGRPIVPVAVVTSRRLQFQNWDRASLGLPFGRGAIVVGTPLQVARDADKASLETARGELEAALNTVHERAYGLVGGQDPGSTRRNDKRRSLEPEDRARTAGPGSR